MLSDQELIDGLRTELAPLQPPVDFVERLREQVAAGARRRVRRPGRGRLFRMPAGSVAVAAGSLVAIALAVGVLFLLGHHGSNAAPTTSTGNPGASERVPTLAQLKANFAVLRRPQTAADRTARTLCAHPCKERVLPGMTRLARTLPDGTKVFLSIGRLRASEQGQPAGSYVLHEDLAYPARSTILDPESLADVRFEVGGVFAVLPATTILGHERAPLWTAIVPDGVSTVRWTFACSRIGRPGRCRRAAESRPVAVDVDVIDNIAAARIPGTGSDATGGVLRRARAIWYSRDGRQVASFTSATAQTTPPFIESTSATELVRPSRAHLALTGGGLGSVRFGASPHQLQRLLDPALGRRYQITNECGVDQELIWPIVLNPATGRVERSEEFVLFFRHARFVGYQYGGDILARRGGGQRLLLHATTKLGLAIGDPLTVGRRLYGWAFQTSAAQGGTWRARTGQGPIRGYASGNPKRGDLGSILIASIDAGDVGCPALSP